MTRQNIVVYRLPGGSLLVNTLVSAPNGWRADGNPTALEPTVDDLALGEAVQAALDRSSETDEVVPRNATYDAALLEAAGVVSWADFVKGTRDVGVYAIDERGPRDGVHITPTRNEGSRGGFTPMSGHRMTLTHPSPTELGAGVRAALELSSE